MFEVGSELVTGLHRSRGRHGQLEVRNENTENSRELLAAASCDKFHSNRPLHELLFADGQRGRSIDGDPRTCWSWTIAGDHRCHQYRHSLLTINAIPLRWYWHSFRCAYVPGAVARNVVLLLMGYKE